MEGTRGNWTQFSADANTTTFGFKSVIVGICLRFPHCTGLRWTGGWFFGAEICWLQIFILLVKCFQEARVLKKTWWKSTLDRETEKRWWRTTEWSILTHAPFWFHSAGAELGLLLLNDLFQQFQDEWSTVSVGLRVRHQHRGFIQKWDTSSYHPD